MCADGNNLVGMVNLLMQECEREFQYQSAVVDGGFRAQAEKLTLEMGKDTFPFDQRRRQGVWL